MERCTEALATIVGSSMKRPDLVRTLLLASRCVLCRTAGRQLQLLHRVGPTPGRRQ